MKTAWEKVQIARQTQRPKTTDYIKNIFNDFIEFHGDRNFGDDKAIIGGIALLDEIPVTVIGEQKGKSAKENMERNFGMPEPEGYRKALRLMKQAEKFKRPIITFIDTPGAYPGVELPEGYVFAGGGSFLENGLYYFPNIPTEEIFSAPKKTGVNGKLYSALPLAYNGAIVRDFWFEFKDGQVVDYDAKEGKEVLTSILDTDEGAKYLGEIALVPYGSPISALNTLFYETLIDENASCHFALGASYNDAVCVLIKLL